MSNPQPAQPPQPLAGIKNGVLFIQAPLHVPNGELMAYGFLTMAEHMVQDYFLQQRMQAELAKQDKTQVEKMKIDLALANK